MKQIRILVASLVLAQLPAVAFSGDVVVAGIDSSMRPVGAPVITEFIKSDGWLEAALSGVGQPYPPMVLQFLEDQGGWFNPFIHPGMTGPYDIRNWH